MASLRQSGPSSARGPSATRRAHAPRAPGRRARPAPGGTARGLSLLALAAATVAAFAGVVRNRFILLDDPLYVLENPHVRAGLTLDGVAWFMGHPHGENWHPLTSISHMLDVQLFGLAPAGHHAVSLALHALNAVLLAIVLARLTGAWGRSVIVAALFALHPLRVESVAWVAERKDVLSGLLFVLAIEAYRRWAERPGPGRYAWLFGVFALGLMSKPMLVTLPFVLVLLDAWPLGRLAGPGVGAAPRPGAAPTRPLAALVGEKWALLALAAASAAVTFLVQRKTGAVTTMALIPPAERICNALIAPWRYIGMTLWPVRLAPYYPHGASPDVAGAVAALVALVLATWGALRLARRRPYLAVGWLWYLGMLVPVIGLIQVGRQAHADRYTYLPAIGLLIALVWGVGDLVGRWRRARDLAAAATAGLLLCLSIATARQVGRWRDTRTLFTHALAVTPDNVVARENLGDALLEAGDARAAIPHLEQAVRLDPEFPGARNNLGTALGLVGRNDEAAVQFQAALRAHEAADPHFNLGYIYAKQGRMDDAIRECEAALRIDPRHYGSNAQLGVALAARGRLDEASAHLRRALEVRPAAIETRRLLAKTLERAGRHDEAMAEYHEILRLSPGDRGAKERLDRGAAAP